MAVSSLPRPVALAQAKEVAALEGTDLERGPRLSPVSFSEVQFQRLTPLAGAQARDRPALPEAPPAAESLLRRQSQ